jgi:lipopolysaccharide export system permease protein
MKILYRYIISEILKIFLVILSAIVMFILISNFVDEISNMQRFKPALILIAEYFICKLPFLASEGAPFAILLSILYVFSQLNRHSELSAIKSAGINFNDIAKPVLGLALVMSVCIIVLNETVVSAAYERATYIKDVLIEKNGGGATNEIRTDLAKLSEGGRVFYIKYFDGLLGIMKGVCILKIDKDFNLLERLDAREGDWAKDKWVLKDAIVRTFKGTQETNVEKFASYDLFVKDAPGDFIVRKKSIEDTLTVNIFRLRDLIKVLKGSGFNANEEETNLNLKIAFPFASFILALLGISIPFILPTSRSLVNVMLGFLLTVLFAFFYVGFVTIGLSLGKVGILPPFISAWIANFLFLGAGFYAFLNVKR